MMNIYLDGNAVDPLATDAQIETVQTDEPIGRWNDSRCHWDLRIPVVQSILNVNIQI